MKIKSHYFLLKRLLDELPSSSERFFLNSQQAENYNASVDRLSSDLTNEDLTQYKIQTTNEYSGGRPQYVTSVARQKLGMLIGFLEGEFDISIESPVQNSPTGPTISVINQNTIAITISQDIQQLIDSSSNSEEKEKLSELKGELAKSSKDWNKIKPILVWAINFSEKLFFQLLPIILKNTGFSS